MGELGPHAESSHREVGGYAAELGVDAVFSVGEEAASSRVRRRSRVDRETIEISHRMPPLPPASPNGCTKVTRFC
ncbi:hypothetical protein [Verrucomicrobium spinosum]|uniref:hypothetical protein n=1 Tax=Verrucomicrobium spinosum TaxID=2736 RepID=UPI003CCDBA0A